MFSTTEHAMQCLSGDAYSEFLLRSIFDHAIYMLDLDGNVLSWNAGAERIKGFRAGQIIGRHFSIFYTDEDRAAGIPDHTLRLAESHGRCESEGWRIRADGTRFWASIVIHAVVVDGQVAGFAKVTRDCTEQKQQSDAADTMRKNMALALSFLPCGACLVDRRGTVVLSNPALADLLPEAVAGVCLADVLQNRAGGCRLPSEGPDAVPWLDTNADPACCEIGTGDRILSVLAKAAEDEGWVVTIEDITTRRQAEREALHKAPGRDILTGLANRDGLDAQLQRGLDACRMTGGCAVLYLDLDRFKVINDTCGHQAGDAVLKEAAKRISSTLEARDFACRLGGDEFIVVLAQPTATGQAREVAERIKGQFDRPFVVDARQIDVGVSIGFAISLPGDVSGQELIGNADLALYKAKREGRSCIRLFDNALGLAMLKRRSLERDLAQALAVDKFRLEYQPICAAGGETVRGFEALLRWTRPDGVQIPPSEFIPLAEDLGLMGEIGAWVLETACRKAAGWPPHLMVAVNVSATQLHDPRFSARVESVLQQVQLDPRRLELEIAETAVMKDHGRTLCALTRIRDLGVGIAIDDFGTGYSSLGALRTLPFTRLKIDRSFITDLVDDPNSMAILRAVMCLSRDLGLEVTAEGVETEAQRRILAAEACQEMQGYLFAKPMRPDAIPSFLEPARPTRTPSPFALRGTSPDGRLPVTASTTF